MPTPRSVHGEQPRVGGTSFYSMPREALPSSERHNERESDNDRDEDDDQDDYKETCHEMDVQHSNLFKFK